MDKIQRLEARIAKHQRALKADQQELAKHKARRRTKTQAEARARETRRKVIVGAIVLKAVATGALDATGKAMVVGLLRGAAIKQAEHDLLVEAIPELAVSESKPTAAKPPAADPADGEAA